MYSMTNPHNHGNYDEITGTVYDANIDRWMPAADFYAHYGIPTYGVHDTRMSTKKVVGISAATILAFLFILGLSAAIFGSPDDDTESPYSSGSNANESMYLEHLEDENIQALEGGDQALLESGYQVCGMLNEGYSVDDIATIGFNSSQENNGDQGLSYTQARKMVLLADDYLCGMSG